MSPENPASLRASAVVLRWQTRLRITIALAIASGALALRAAGVLEGTLLPLGMALLAYLGVLGAVRYWLARVSIMPDIPVVATILGDLAFVMVVTASTSAPEYYGRILVVALFVVHFAQSYFGRRHAVVAVAVASLAYLSLVSDAMDAGAQLYWAEELWSVVLFVAAAVSIIAHYGYRQRRLRRLVDLFERAEEGDFSQSYDVAHDRYPDEITRVGRAYNRVRIQLASMLLTDPLTGCLNRRGFDQSMAREIARASRNGAELSLLALDLDNFKRVNDSYGHLAGDAVLREFGALLVQSARVGDMVARTGGEEFSILLPDTNADGASLFANRLCEVIRRHIFLVNGKPLRLTVSVGVMSSSAGHVDETDANLKQRADEALYSAKRAGRDQVCIWTETLRPFDVAGIGQGMWPLLDYEG